MATYRCMTSQTKLSLLWPSQADMVQHKDKSQLALLLSLNNRYTHFLVHSRDVLLRAMVVSCPSWLQLWILCCELTLL